MLLLSVFTIVLPYFSVFMMSLATVYLIVTEEARMGLSVEPSCQRDIPDSKVWIMVLSLGLFAFTRTIMLIVVHVGPTMFLLPSLFAGLVSMIIALAMKTNRVEIADLSNQEPL